MYAPCEIKYNFTNILKGLEVASVTLILQNFENASEKHERKLVVTCLESALSETVGR